MGGYLVGCMYSSTRAEIAAAIFALTSNQSVYLASGSKASVDQCKKLLIATRHQQSKPWALHKDGDVWEIVHPRIV